MPVYEYECTKCGHHTEILQKISDTPVTQCELCKGGMKKLISMNTFHLKGTGWYVTDYASKSGGYDGKNGKSDKNDMQKEAKSSSDSPKKEASPSDAGEKKVKAKE